MYITNNYSTYVDDVGISTHLSHPSFSNIASSGSASGVVEFDSPDDSVITINIAHLTRDAQVDVYDGTTLIDSYTISTTTDNHNITLQITSG